MCFLAVIEGRACAARCGGVRIEYHVDLCADGVVASNGDVLRCRRRNRVLESVPSPVMCGACEAAWLAAWDAWIERELRALGGGGGGGGGSGRASGAGSGSCSSAVLLFFDMDEPTRRCAASRARAGIRRANAALRRNFERERARLLALLRDELEYAGVLFDTTGVSASVGASLPVDARRASMCAGMAGLPRWQVDYAHYEYMYRLIPDMVKHYVLDSVQRESGRPLGLRRGREDGG